MTDPVKLNYVEFPTADLTATKAFFASAFGWQFQDYGAEYTAFTGQGLDGGFYKSATRPSNDGALLVFYSSKLEHTLEKVKAAGGKIVRPIFAFPGGRRFHFEEPGGNELAVWSGIEP